MDGAVIYGMGFGIDGMAGVMKGQAQGENGNGIFKGEYQSPDIGTGQLGGKYQSVESDDLGIFLGHWENSAGSADSQHKHGNLAGLWQVLTDEGDGEFVGYWSKCNN
jgi:hypothetical protein